MPEPEDEKKQADDDAEVVYITREEARQGVEVETNKKHVFKLKVEKRYLFSV